MVHNATLLTLLVTCQDAEAKQKRKEKLDKDNSETLLKFNIPIENLASRKERVVFQPTMFRGELLVLGNIDIVLEVAARASSRKVGKDDSSTYIFMTYYTISSILLHTF